MRMVVLLQTRMEGTAHIPLYPTCLNEQMLEGGQLTFDEAHLHPGVEQVQSRNHHPFTKLLLFLQKQWRFIKSEALLRQR